MEKRFEKLQELLTNEETAKKLLVLTAEEASSVLAAEYGVDFTADELNDIMQGMKDAAKELADGELSVEDLDLVAGGGKGSEAYQFGRSAGRAAPIVVALVTVAVLTGW